MDDIGSWLIEDATSSCTTPLRPLEANGIYCFPEAADLPLPDLGPVEVLTPAVETVDP